MCVKDINNDDVKGFRFTKICIKIHNTIDMLKYLTTGPEVGLSHGVQNVRCTAQGSDKKTGESNIRLQHSFSV